MLLPSLAPASIIASPMLSAAIIMQIPMINAIIIAVEVFKKTSPNQKFTSGVLKVSKYEPSWLYVTEKPNSCEEFAEAVIEVIVIVFQMFLITIGFTPHLHI